MTESNRPTDPVTLTLEAAKAAKVPCAYGGCPYPVTCIAVGRGDRDFMRLDFYCDTHGDMAANQDPPEYDVHCPNCGCRFGVN